MIKAVSAPCKRGLAALLVALFALVPAAHGAEPIRVAVLATSDAPEVQRLRAENAVATHRDLELAAERSIATGAPRRALVDAARRDRADLLLVVDAHTTRLWDSHRGRWVGTPLPAGASRAALRGLLAEGLQAARPPDRHLPGWLSVAVAGAAAALFATFVIIRVSEPEPESGVTLRVVSP